MPRGSSSPLDPCLSSGEISSSLNGAKGITCSAKPFAQLRAVSMSPPHSEILREGQAGLGRVGCSGSATEVGLRDTGWREGGRKEKKEEKKGKRERNNGPQGPFGANNRNGPQPAADGAPRPLLPIPHSPLAPVTHTSTNAQSRRGLWPLPPPHSDWKLRTCPVVIAMLPRCHH